MATEDLCLQGAISLSPPSTFPATLQLLNPLLLADAHAVAVWVRTHRPALTALLASRGALIFRGFPLATSLDFSVCVASFEWTDLPYENSLSLAVRTPVCARVCTTNDGRDGGLIFHHEQAAAPLFPSKLFFFAETPAPPGTGGGTALCPSWLLLERLEAAHPAFVADCERLGIVYRLTLPPAADTRSGVGRSWRSFFSVDTPAAAEARMAALGYTHTWGAGEVLHVATPVLPPLRAVPGPRGPATRVFFNQILAQVLGNAREFAAQGGAPGGAAAAAAAAATAAAATATAAPPCISFGDGTPLPLAPVEFAFKVCEEELAVEVVWQKGDIALVDNFLTMHARRPWSGDGPRRVLASLVV